MPVGVQQGQGVLRVLVAQEQEVRVVQHEQEGQVVAPASPPQVLRVVLRVVVQVVLEGESIAKDLEYVQEQCRDSVR